MRSRNKRLPASGSLLLGFALLSLVGCDQAQPVAYKIPKESREVTMPAMPAASSSSAPSANVTATPGSPSGMQVLPGMSDAAEQAGTILYTVPEGWTDLGASGIRKAYLQVKDENGSADLTITAFPGDVGGVLANINRWRGQIQLDPISDQEIGTVAKPYQIFQHNALYVSLDGGVDSILAAILPFHGYTWFIKLQGSSSTVFGQEAQLEQFLKSIEMEGHAH